MSVSQNVYARYMSGYSKAEICLEFGITGAAFDQIKVAVGSQLYLEMWLIFGGN